MTDIEYWYKNFRNAILGIDYEEIEPRFGSNKPPLILYPHQDIFSDNFLEGVKNGETVFLFGAKARSGKTMCVGGVAKKYLETNKKLNMLIATPIPKETISQFTDGLFNRFQDFSTLNIVEIRQGSDIDEMVLKENNIIVVSKQLLDNYTGDERVKRIFNLDLDIIVYDESHYHMTTVKSAEILTAYSTPRTVKLFLTATYSKPLIKWKIPVKNQFYWDVEDEKLCKNRNLKELARRHGDVVYRYITEENKNEVLKIYDEMPELYILSSVACKQKLDRIREKIQGTPYGFSTTTLLCGKYDHEVDSLLKLISGSDKEKDFPDGENWSFFGRMIRISVDNGSRTLFTNNNFTTQLWFLPFGKGRSIVDISEYLRGRMILDSVLKEFEIVILNSSQEYEQKNVKNFVENNEIRAKKNGKRGLIVLLGMQLSMGITLPNVDVVFLLGHHVSSDLIYQMLSRCMTERTNASNHLNPQKKKYGFVVDLNPSRVLSTIVGYGCRRHDLDIEQKLQYIIRYNLINIDNDFFGAKKINGTETIKKLMEEWKACANNDYKQLVRKIRETNVIVSAEIQECLNELFMELPDNPPIQIKTKMDEKNEEPLPTGIQNLPVEMAEEKTETTKPVKNISFSRDVLDLVIPLLCILTLKTHHRDIFEMFRVVRTDSFLFKVFKSQLKIWWGNRYCNIIIYFLRKALKLYIKEDSEIYNTTVNLKMALYDCINQPEKLLERINDGMRTTPDEKNKYGEVFTPMEFIEKILDKLDGHYKKTYGKSIFSNPSLTWFDPAVGMGNFLVAVYLRLMKGLKEIFPDEETRKSHIIQKMLFMSELNKKNVFICHQIFGKYKPNIHEGDTLKMSPETVFGIRSFDVVLGNPPYNKNGIRRTGKTKDESGEKAETIWKDFIMYALKYLKQNGFLCFINPPRWLRKNGKDEKIHDFMLRNYIIWIELMDGSETKKMFEAELALSFYILQKSPNTNRNLTEITSTVSRAKIFLQTEMVYLHPDYPISLLFQTILSKIYLFIKKNSLKLNAHKHSGNYSNDKKYTKLPEKYTAEDMWGVATFLREGSPLSNFQTGVMVKKLHTRHPLTTVRKLIVANKTTVDGAFIDNGNLGLTGGDKFYILGDNLEVILKILNFKITKIIMSSTYFRFQYLDADFWDYIPDFRKMGYTDITEPEFYDLLGLTPTEISQIEKFKN